MISYFVFENILGYFLAIEDMLINKKNRKKEPINKINILVTTLFFKIRRYSVKEQNKAKKPERHERR